MGLHPSVFEPAVLIVGNAPPGGDAEEVRADLEAIEHAQKQAVHVLAHPPAGKAWATPQRDWLRRIAAQTKANTLVDRDALDDPDLLFTTQVGGFQRLDRIFGGQLLPTLDAFNDSIWAQPAP